MNDQEQITDLLFCEKKMSANYNEYASECVNPQLQKQFLDILEETHEIQAELFSEAKSKGWYKVEQAPASKVDQALQKFTQEAPAGA